MARNLLTKSAASLPLSAPTHRGMMAKTFGVVDIREAAKYRLRNMPTKALFAPGQITYER